MKSVLTKASEDLKEMGFTLASPSDMSEKEIESVIGSKEAFDAIEEYLRS